jgi:hypothetical protein
VSSLLSKGFSLEAVSLRLGDANPTTIARCRREAGREAKVRYWSYGLIGEVKAPYAAVP